MKRWRKGFRREWGMKLGTGRVSHLELGDARQTQRLIKLVDDLSAQPTGSIPLACGGCSETKTVYRLLDNPAVEWREILDADGGAAGGATGGVV